MVSETIRRKVIHRVSEPSTLHVSETQAVLQCIAERKCLLTTPSLLSSGTRRDSTNEGAPRLKHLGSSRCGGTSKGYSHARDPLILREGMPISHSRNVVACALSNLVVLADANRFTTM